MINNVNWTDDGVLMRLSLSLLPGASLVFGTLLAVIVGAHMDSLSSDQHQHTVWVAALVISNVIIVKTNSTRRICSISFRISVCFNSLNSGWTLNSPFKLPVRFVRRSAGRDLWPPASFKNCWFERVLKTNHFFTWTLQTLPDEDTKLFSQED